MNLEENFMKTENNHEHGNATVGEHRAANIIITAARLSLKRARIRT
jgi:hypothetical protein